MPSPIITFKDVWDVMCDKKLARDRKHDDSYLLAEGLMDGKVVASHKVMPARRPSKLLLWADNENVEMTADGSDLVTVIAAVADDKGNIKRLNNYHIKFEVEGTVSWLLTAIRSLILVRYNGGLLRYWYVPIRLPASLR